MKRELLDQNTHKRLFTLFVTEETELSRWIADIHAPVTRSEPVCSVLNISGNRADVIICLSRDTFEPTGAGLVFLRHHPQPLRGMRMRNLARHAPTQGGMIQ